MVRARSAPGCVLTLNAGSSSIRFALFDGGPAQRRILDGAIDRIGTSGARLSVNRGGGVDAPRRIAAVDHRSASKHLLDWLQAEPLFERVASIGHRIVHGMRHTAPEWVTPRLLSELRRLTPYDPDHLPIEIGLIEEVRRRLPSMPQVACFDTAFHRSMPLVAKLLPIPWRYRAKGVERYGFHGLSYQYLLGELRRLGDRSAVRGRVILAHLGNGASMAAVLRGKSIDTSMGFTPAAGLVMGTRSGDLDPGLLAYLSRNGKMSASQFERMINHESGLLGISGRSADMRDLLADERRDSRVAIAVADFCYQARKWIGAYAAALGGLDSLVFAGGIGENSPEVRARICGELGFLGVHLDASANRKSATVISRRGSPVVVRVIHTDEELMIARSVERLFASRRNDTRQ